MFDQDGQPPRGLQLNLGNRKVHLIHDTLVMANLGYYQVRVCACVLVLFVRVRAWKVSRERLLSR